MGNCLRPPSSNTATDVWGHGTAQASTSNPSSQAANTIPGSQEQGAVESVAGSRIADMWLSSLERPGGRSSRRSIRSTAQAPVQSNLDERRQSMLERAVTLVDHWQAFQERCAGTGVGDPQARHLNILKRIIERNKQALENIGGDGGHINERHLDQIERQLRRFEINISNQKKLESHLARATDLLGRLRLLQNQLATRGYTNEILDGVDSKIKELEGLLNELARVDADGTGIDYDGSHGDAIASFDSLTLSFEVTLASQEPGYEDYMKPALTAFLKDDHSSSRRMAGGDPGMHGGGSHGIS
ncbi:hypothetical protein [Xanthomonas campestris]|uniref:hypothetical protein n=1 Tax=Xanthomonas campestris TaxID=339 RepID=UPI002B1CD401|nr:hypothetical protein [Xanthomonas campestris]